MHMQADTTTENWVGVLQEVMLPAAAADVPAFLKAAVEYVNTRRASSSIQSLSISDRAITDYACTRCLGTLSMAMFVPPDTQRDHADAVEEAIAGLQYGGIAINLAPVAIYCTPKLGWGAFPGAHTPQVDFALPVLAGTHHTKLSALYTAGHPLRRWHHCAQHADV